MNQNDTKEDGVLRLNMSGRFVPGLETYRYCYYPVDLQRIDEEHLVKTIAKTIREELGNDRVKRTILVSPGLTPLALRVVSILLGLTGHLPEIQPIVHNDRTGEYNLGEIVNLDDLHEISNAERLLMTLH